MTKLLSVYIVKQIRRDRKRERKVERERERAIRLVTVSSTGLEPAVNCLLNSLGKLDYAVCQ